MRSRALISLGELNTDEARKRRRSLEIKQLLYVMLYGDRRRR